MRVIYQGIDLLVLRTRSVAYEPVYDDSGTDYLYTRVSVAVEALVNGQAEVVNLSSPNGPFISYDFTSTVPDTPSNLPRRPQTPLATPVPLGAPPAAGTTPSAAGIARGLATTLLRGIRRVPNVPPLTHATVRHRLTTPQGKLWVFAGPGMESGVPAPGGAGAPVAPAVVMIESPLRDQGRDRATDCKNGPTPRLLDVTEAVGDATTMTVNWECETYVRDDDINSVNPRGMLLSNRYHQFHDVDETGYTTVTTEGLAIFRTDLVYAAGISPDSERPLLFMPIPFGFQRENIHVEGRPDVSGIAYAYQDRQVPVNFVAGSYNRTAKISAVHRQAVTSNANILDGALTVYERTVGAVANTRFAFPGDERRRRRRRPRGRPADPPPGP